MSGEHYFWLGADGAQPDEASPKPDAVACEHDWRGVWNDYRSSCRECSKCGHSEVWEYFK